MKAPGRESVGPVAVVLWCWCPQVAKVWSPGPPPSALSQGLGGASPCCPVCVMQELADPFITSRPALLPQPSAACPLLRGHLTIFPDPLSAGPQAQSPQGSNSSSSLYSRNPEPLSPPPATLFCPPGYLSQLLAIGILEEGQAPVFLPQVPGALARLGTGSCVAFCCEETRQGRVVASVLRISPSLLQKFHTCLSMVAQAVIPVLWEAKAGR